MTKYDFIARRRKLNAAIAEGARRSEMPPPASPTDVVARRVRDEPSTEILSLRATIAARQAIGDPPTNAANDNEKPKRAARVRKSIGKYVRGAMAESLPAVIAYRNTPDHLPEPVTSYWSTDPAEVITETELNDDGDEIILSADDQSLEIRPSICEIMRQVACGPISYGKVAAAIENRPAPKRAPVVAIGKLKFSDGAAQHKVVRKTEGGVVERIEPAPAGAMLGTVEKLGSGHGGDKSAVATLSNRRTVALFFGKDKDENPINWRPYIPKGDTRSGTSYTAAQSRILIACAIANTPVMPPVTYCPPGVASGTARFSDQFVGLVSGSTGKGGAPNWVDHFTALQQHAEWMAAVAAMDKKSKSTIESSLTAKNFADVGIAAGHGAEYARRKGGRLALIAANDNLAAAIKKLAA